MKTLIFVLISIYFRKWYENERDKVFPVMIVKNIEQENERRVRVNVRTKPGF